MTVRNSRTTPSPLPNFLTHLNQAAPALEKLLRGPCSLVWFSPSPPPPPSSFHVLRKKTYPGRYFTIVYALFSVAVAVSTHLCVLSRHLICLMSLFQGHDACVLSVLWLLVMPLTSCALKVLLTKEGNMMILDLRATPLARSLPVLLTIDRKTANINSKYCILSTEPKWTVSLCFAN